MWISSMKYALRTEGRWLVVSDNPDWPPAPLLYGTDIVGEVRWLGRTF